MCLDARLAEAARASAHPFHAVAARRRQGTRATTVDATFYTVVIDGVAELPTFARSIASARRHSVARTLDQRHAQFGACSRGACAAFGSGGEDSNPQWQGQNLLCCQLHHPRRAELSLPGVCLGPVLEGHAESMDAS